MRLSRYIVPFLLCLALALPLGAQDIKIVSGKVTNSTTNAPFGNETAVWVYVFYTVYDAEQAMKVLESGGGNIFANVEESADNNGYYEVRVPDNGALIFKVDMVDEPVMVKVNKRTEINVSIKGGNILKAAVKSAELTSIAPMPENPEMEGNMLKVKAIIPIPRFNGKTNARMIMQPFLFSGETGDTLEYLRPFVIDGREYTTTQQRRMGFDLENDSLTPYKREIELTSERMNIEWADTIEVKDPTKSYFVRGVVLLEDYNTVYFHNDYELASARVRRPLRFLEYSLEHRDLDPEEYKETPQRERRKTDAKISLTFKIGKAELDDSDSLNQIRLDSIKNIISGIVHGEDTQLKEFHIKGVSSPDGGYDRNLALAKARMQFAQNQILSVLSSEQRRGVYMPVDAEVAHWSDVADLMMADSLKTEADEIYSIVAQYPDSHDRQGAQIRRLPYYKDLIVDYLPKLRSIEYTYVQEINRALTPAEILDRYENDEDYRSGRKQFALYEYWNLFQMVKDEDELMALYKRAYEESKQVNGKGWILAANNLASEYIKRGIVDTTVLAPFIDTHFQNVDLKIMHMNGRTYDIVNPEEVVCNQLCMKLRSNDFKGASVLAQMLPDTKENEMIKAFTLCLGGYYRGASEQAVKTRELVRESSPRNKVVMYLAMNSAAGNVLAEEALAGLPMEDALTKYFWAVISSRKYENNPNDIMSLMTASDFLAQCFFQDSSYVDIAAGDADINKDIYKDAEERYKSGSLY